MVPLETSALSRRYGRLVALEAPSLTVGPGECVLGSTPIVLVEGRAGAGVIAVTWTALAAATVAYLLDSDPADT